MGLNSAHRRQWGGCVCGGASCCVTHLLCHDSVWLTPSRNAPTHGCQVRGNLLWELSSQPRGLVSEPWVSTPAPRPPLTSPHVHDRVISGPWDLSVKHGVILCSQARLVLPFCLQHFAQDFNFNQSLRLMNGGGRRGGRHKTTAPLRWVITGDCGSEHRSYPTTLSMGDRTPLSPDHL